VSRRASLPGAEELFRKTSSAPESKPATRSTVPEPEDDKSTHLQVASPAAPTEVRKGPKHDEKITFYCTGDDLMALEKARLQLRSGHGLAADRGRIVRAALRYVLEDFEARGEDAVLLRKLGGKE
jgi:hypothetical protein